MHKVAFFAGGDKPASALAPTMCTRGGAWAACAQQPPTSAAAPHWLDLMEQHGFLVGKGDGGTGVAYSSRTRNTCDTCGGRSGELVGCDNCARVFHNTKKCWVSHGAVDPRGRVACRHCWGAAILKAKAKAHEAALDCSPGPAAKATNTLCTQHKTCVLKTKTNKQ